MDAERNAMVFAKVRGSRIQTPSWHQRVLDCTVRANAAHALFSGNRRGASLGLSANIAICALGGNTAEEESQNGRSARSRCAQKQKELMLRVFFGCRIKLRGG